MVRKISEYRLTSEDLLQLQSIQKDMIAEVDRICRKCGIHYNMVGGTNLGAIRHQGYIPLHDDADMGCLRTDYEKFREECKSELNQ